MSRRRKRDVDAVVEGILDGEPIPGADLAPADGDVLRTAIGLRAARPGADAPSEEFLARLRGQVDATVSGADVGAEAPAAGDLRFSRRSVLAAAAAVTGAGALGAAVDHALAPPGPSAPAAAGPAGTVTPNTGGWVQVATAADVGSGGSHRFVTAGAVGFVTEHAGRLVAVSGVCTHVGCLLRANVAAGRLDCPCHRTSFAPDGQVLFSQLSTPPAPLPAFGVRSREDGAVEVFVPVDT